jgi:hypothetical protein
MLTAPRDKPPEGSGFRRRLLAQSFGSRMKAAAFHLIVVVAIVRLWGDSQAEDPEWARLLASIPADMAAILDLTNWDSEGTLPPQFQRLTTRTPPIRWIVSPKWGETLKRRAWTGPTSTSGKAQAASCSRRASRGAER